MVQLNGFAVAIITDGDQDKLKRQEGDYVGLDNNTEYKLKLSNYHDTDAMADVYIENDNVGTWFIPSNDSIVIERPSDTNRKFTFVKETDYRASRAGVVAGESTNGLIKVIFFPKKRIPIVMTAPRYPGLRSSQFSRPSEATSPRRSQSTYESNIPSLSQYSTLSRAASPQRSQSTYQSNISSSSLYSRSLSPERYVKSSSQPQYQSGATVLGDVSHQQFGTRMKFSNDEIDWPNKTTITIRLVARVYHSRHMYEPYVSIGNRNVAKHENNYPPRIDW